MRMQINRLALFYVFLIMCNHSYETEQAGVNEHLQNEINASKKQLGGQKNKIESLEHQMSSSSTDKSNFTNTAVCECHTASDLSRLEAEMSGLRELVNIIEKNVENIVDLFYGLNDSFTSFSKNVKTSAYSQWSSWTVCSNGSQARYRICSFGNKDSPFCRGPTYDRRLCCPFGYSDLQEFGFPSCIRYYHLWKTHASAKAFCENENAHLIEITSKEKKAVVKDYIAQQKNLNNDQYFHIDGELVNGTWVNRDGVPLNYLPWGAKPYLKPGWIYLGLHPADFLIYDIQIDYVRQFVCEVGI